MDFEFYLRNRTSEKGQKPLNNNGLMKHLERFCKMINLAVRLKWIDRNPFQAYQLKSDKFEREYLTAVELKNIEVKEFKIVRLQIVKDLNYELTNYSNGLCKVNCVNSCYIKSKIILPGNQIASFCAVVAQFASGIIHFWLMLLWAR